MQDVKSSFPKHKIVAVHCKGIVENEMNLEKWLNEISKHLKQSKQTISLPMQGVAGLSSSMLHIYLQMIRRGQSVLEHYPKRRSTLPASLLNSIFINWIYV